MKKFQRLRRWRCKHWYKIKGRDLFHFFIECKHCSKRRIIWRYSDIFGEDQGKDAWMPYWDKKSLGYSAWKKGKTDQTPLDGIGDTDLEKFKRWLKNPLASMEEWTKDERLLNER